VSGLGAAGGGIRVLVVDDDALVRTGLRLLLGGAPDITVVGDVTDGDEVLDAVLALRPHVVLMDLRMPRLDGVSALRVLRAAGGEQPAVIVLTTFRTDAVVLEALRAGASGFLVKHTPPAEIVEAVRTAAAGDPAVSPEVLRQLIEHVAGDPGGGASASATDCTAQAAARALSVLTVREREVADAVAEGLGNAEIGGRLHLSHGSVKAHISSALAKLGLENRIQLAVLAHDARRER
jgi:DNA-binding NarL/FixJ family response regulator